MVDSTPAEADAGKCQAPSSIKDVNDTLPPLDQITELFDVFFSSYHSYLPSIHQKTFLHCVTNRHDVAKSSPLFWVLLAVAVSDHPNPHLRAHRYRWLALAQSYLDRNITNCPFPTQYLQAAVWMVFQSYVSADLTAAWFFLGKTCRLANLLGFDRVDCTRVKRSVTMTAEPRDYIEKEERRKSMWALFFLDRSISCLAGFSLAIDERHFCVDFPLDEKSFQASTPNLSSTCSTSSAFSVVRIVLQPVKSNKRLIQRNIVSSNYWIGSLHNRPYHSYES